MKKFFKLMLIPVAFLTTTFATGCNMANKEVALITDVGDIDDGSFNQAAWEAVKEYCTDPTHPHTFDYYRPFADSNFAQKCAVKQAIYKGAKIVICPGFKFGETVSQCQNEYPNVHFLLIDKETSNDVQPNTVCITYKAEISGFLAGAAVAEDYLNFDYSHGYISPEYKYGYCGGMASDGVLQFGFGFIQGVVCATERFMREKAPQGVDYPNLTFRYMYSGVFAQDDATAIKMKSWYTDDVKTIFACGGKLYQSITEGVKDYNRKNNCYDFKEGEAPRNAARWVGVDSDQYTGLRDEHEKKTIITSALKRLDQTVKSVLQFHFDDAWDVIGGPYLNNDSPKDKMWSLGIQSELGHAGKAHEHGIKLEPEDYVGIPTAHDETTGIMRGFNNFTIQQYKTEIDRIGSNEQYVYGGNGTGDIADENHNYRPNNEKTFGIPDFMSNSKKWYIELPGGRMNFNTTCFNGYNPDLITVQIN